MSCSVLCIKTQWRKATGLTLLQKYHAGKSIIQVPEVNTTSTTLVVQLPVHIEGLVGRNLKLPYPFTGHGPIIKWRVEFIAPGRPVAVTVPIVVAEQVVAVALRTPTNLERLVNGRKEVFSEVWDNARNCLQVALRVTGVEAPQEVPGSMADAGQQQQHVGWGCGLQLMDVF